MGVDKAEHITSQHLILKIKNNNWKELNVENNQSSLMSPKKVFLKTLSILLENLYFNSVQL